MALSLTAEQKSIFDIFSGKNQYIIPPYQRAYSWTENQCIELFDDLEKAYHENKEEGYFLGNIVIAKSIEERNRLEVIDGQQRLTTLTLLMKVLSTFDNTSEDLKNAINIPGSRRNDAEKQRLMTNVFIEKDSKYLEEVLNMDFNEESCKTSRRENQFKKNICFFYNKIKEFSKNNNIEDFTDFFLYDVSLLPIQTEDSSPEKAREKALKIFETINNRGLSLSDSDIFKAKLYSIALNQLKHDEFIQKWKDLDEECISINYSINDIFRFYTHIIRGKNTIKTAEIGLREFFTQRDYSPFNNKVSYEEILNDLFTIIDVIKFYKNVLVNPDEHGMLTKWFQLISEYSNQYALSTLIVYLYTFGLKNDQELVEFSKNLVRYSYYQGSTSKVKFYLFEVIVSLAKDKKQEFIYYPERAKSSDFEYFGKLKQGFSLLSLYLDDNQKAIYPYYFNRIVQSRDIQNLDESWNEIEYDSYVDTLGNMMIIDHNITRDTRLNKKIQYLKKSKISEINSLSNELENWSYDCYLNRENRLKSRILDFFEKPNEDN